MSTDGLVGSLGAQLRATRVRRKLSLSDVQSGTNISASFLSLVENGKSDLTIGRLARLVEFYGISIDDLLPGRAHGELLIHTPDSGRKLNSEGEGVTLSMLSPSFIHEMTPMSLHFKPGAGLDEFGRHLGDEFIYVLDGTLTLEIEGRNPATLIPGSSAYYSGQIPHRFRNSDPNKELHMLCIDSHNRWH